MDINWTAHLSNPEKIEEWKKQILNAKPVLEHLTKMLQKKSNSIERGEASSMSFDNPSWAYKQAYAIGRKAEIRDIIRTIDIDKQVITL